MIWSWRTWCCFSWWILNIRRTMMHCIFSIPRNSLDSLKKLGWVGPMNPRGIGETNQSVTGKISKLGVPTAVVHPTPVVVGKHLPSWGQIQIFRQVDGEIWSISGGFDVQTPKESEDQFPPSLEFFKLFRQVCSGGVFCSSNSEGNLKSWWNFGSKPFWTI